MATYENNTGATEKQKAFLRDLCNDTGIVVPRELDSMSSAAATAQIDQLRVIRQDQAGKKKTASQTTAAPATQPAPKRLSGWDDGNYSPVRLGMCFKLACDELNANKIRPSYDGNTLVRVTIELYGLSLKAEKEAIRLHRADGASGSTDGGDEE